MMSRRITGPERIFRHRAGDVQTRIPGSDNAGWPYHDTGKENVFGFEKTFVRRPNVVYTVPCPIVCAGYFRIPGFSGREPSKPATASRSPRLTPGRKPRCTAGPGIELGGLYRGGRSLSRTLHGDNDGHLIRIRSTGSAGIAGGSLPLNGQSTLFCSPGRESRGGRNTADWEGKNQ